MKLSEYIREERGNGAALAAALDISPSYLSQLATPGASVSPVRCVAIEAATEGKVTRKDLRPDDWEAIWPELAIEQQPKKCEGTAHPDNGQRRRSTDKPQAHAS
jgi:DNA-binding transcriptional regulator YdaS (Cro superfamily)